MGFQWIALTTYARTTHTHICAMNLFSFTKSCVFETFIHVLGLGGLLSCLFKLASYDTTFAMCIAVTRTILLVNAAHTFSPITVRKKKARKKKKDKSRLKQN